MRKGRYQQSDSTITPLGSQGLTRLFAIDFVGDNEKTNILRAKKARDSLRNPDGSWLELLVPAATGDTKAYMNVDKFPKVERVKSFQNSCLKSASKRFLTKSFP